MRGLIGNACAPILDVKGSLSLFVQKFTVSRQIKSVPFIPSVKTAFGSFSLPKQLEKDSGNREEGESSS